MSNVHDSGHHGDTETQRAAGRIGASLKGKRCIPVVLCVLCASVVSVAGEKDEADRALERGLAYLARTQKVEEQKAGVVVGEQGYWETGKRNAVTALCLLAFLAGGHTPAENTYAPVCRRALCSLIASVPDDGYIGKTDGSRMYGQGIVALALAEAYGMERDQALRARLKAKLDKLVKVILEAQARKKSPDHQGGWRYEPDSGDSDLSLSGWCALALRSARNCGMDVPKSAVERAADYVERMYHKREESFAYQRNGRVSLATTGVGVLALHLLGREESGLIEPAARRLVKKPVRKHQKWLYYTLYYTTQAANQVGLRPFCLQGGSAAPAPPRQHGCRDMAPCGKCIIASQGREIWEAVWKNNSELLVRHQEKDGGWPKDSQARDAGRPFSTAMAVLALSVRNHFLPSYQR